MSEAEFKLEPVALSYLAGGVSIIPVGSDKRPHNPSLPKDHDTGKPTWKPFQTTRATAEQVTTWVNTRGVTGVAGVGGAVSGGLLIIDFDIPRFYGAWMARVSQLADGLPVQRTGRDGGGFQVWLRCPSPGPNQELAHAPAPDEPSGRKAAIETRGEGGYALMPGSLHPSGRRYEVVGGDFANIPTIDQERAEALLQAARDLQEAPLTKKEEERALRAKPKARRTSGAGTGVIAQWNTRVPIREMLARAGYTPCGDRFTRPGVNPMSGGVVVLEERLSYHHSTNDPLHDGHAHDSFSVFCELDHNGDVGAAVKAAAKELGIDLTTSGTVNRMPYAEEGGSLVYMKSGPDGSVCVPLANFSGRIVADLVEDDGVERRRTFVLRASLAGSQPTQFEVAADQFPLMTWPIRNLGARAVIFPGFSGEAHTRTAIQLLSADEMTHRTAYAHLGWREIDGASVYLHAGGGIGAAGVVPNVDVRLEGSLSRYILPAPSEGDALIAAIRASRRTLTLGHPRIVYPAFAAIWRSVMGVSLDFYLFLVGRTQVFKTELAALLQRHFGPSMDRVHLPASWSSTANAIEEVAFRAKDAILVVDDFKPASANDDKLHQSADRVLRAQGNGSGRLRLRADATPRPPRPPRGLIVATGEDVPRGESLRARGLIIDICPGDLDASELTICQSDAAAGLYAQALSGFVCWLAKNHRAVCDGHAARVAALRATFTAPQPLVRQPGLLADLYLGFELWTRFAVDSGAITPAEGYAGLAACRSALCEAGRAQVAYQVASDPVARYIELVASAIASGRAHVADRRGGEPSEAPGGAVAWGWREEMIGVKTIWKPQGERIGWIEGLGLYLNPEAAYKVVQAQATGGEGLPLSESTLRRRLFERHLLLTTEHENGSGPLTVRTYVENKRQRVLHLSADTIAETKDDLPI